ncbi:MAG TPA: NADH-quinone oxidoreductase subunit L, partial [Bacteroidetes bacterium]|nr:NADH-quinone oxidoreductase subunit L [Bacteroidota bacterium]
MALSELTYLPTAFLCAFLLMGLLLAYFVFQVFFGHKLGKMGPWLAVTVSGTVAILSIIVWYSQYSSADENSSHSFIQIIYINWFSLGNKLKVNLGFDLRWIHATMLPLVSSITFLVHLFSVEYMKRDRYNHRFWAYLALFSFAMCGLVLADNFLMLFIFWEIMGLASYFLIGFWFGKTTPAKASQKAFIINRIGDVGFVVALMAMFSSYGNFNLDQIYLATMSAGPAAAFSLENWLIVGGLMLGVAGKSAQFPLQVWLPDAMAGPTPVSSLIHAATMVAAGVFLLVQISILFTLEMRILVIIVGCTTALMAAISALSQTDIKAVLAYSTISQLGFMVAAIGMGASNSAFFHLVTHAFFKCGLFLTAGVVIYRLHRAQDAAGIHYDAQDLRWMGGLRKKMPLTFITYVIFAAALAGLPFTSGFLSKDGILIQAIEIGLAKGGLFWLAPSSLILASLLTAIYITRHGILIFGHSFRAGKQDEFKAVEQYLRPANWKMAIPLLVLASMSLWVVYSPLTPFHGEFGHILHNIQWGQTPVYFKWLPLLFAGVA